MASRTPSSAGQGMDPTAHHTAAMRGNPEEIQWTGSNTFQAESIRRYCVAKVMYRSRLNAATDPWKFSDNQRPTRAIMRPKIPVQTPNPAKANAGTAKNHVAQPWLAAPKAKALAPAALFKRGSSTVARRPAPSANRKGPSSAQVWPTSTSFHTTAQDRDVPLPKASEESLRHFQASRPRFKGQSNTAIASQEAWVSVASVSEAHPPWVDNVQVSPAMATNVVAQERGRRCSRTHEEAFSKRGLNASRREAYFVG